jgi:hypothetical protein
VAACTSPLRVGTARLRARIRPVTSLPSGCASEHPCCARFHSTPARLQPRSSAFPGGWGRLQPPRGCSRGREDRSHACCESSQSGCTSQHRRSARCRRRCARPGGHLSASTASLLARRGPRRAASAAGPGSRGGVRAGSRRVKEATARVQGPRGRMEGPSARVKAHAAPLGAMLPGRREVTSAYFGARRI